MTKPGFVEAITVAVEARPEVTATIFEGRARSWPTLLARAGALAGGLRALGVENGTRVAVLAHNSDDYVSLYLAIPRAGGVITPLNWRWSASENLYALKDCAPKLLFVDDHIDRALLATLQEELPTLTIVTLGDIILPGSVSLAQLLTAEPVADARRGGDDVFGIFYTGGTTGNPKGVVLSHASVLGNAIALRSVGPIPDDAVMLIVAPLFHLAAGSTLICTMLAGGTAVIDSAFDPVRTLDLIEQSAVTDIFLVPTMIAMLLAQPSFAPDRLRTLERVVYGASPISTDTLERILAALPEVCFYQAYGMTETSSAVTVLDHEFNGRAHREAGRSRAAGCALPDVRIMIADADGAALPPNSVGEILVGGPMLMLGYLNQPDATRAALRDGWMHTGDGGYVDANGFLYVVDRLKDMIVSGGENIYSAEVESALAAHAAVAQCAVIGVPDVRWGERVHAVVVTRPDALVTEDELVAHCRTMIGGFKVPRSIEFKPGGLPLSAAGKVLKHELRAGYWQGHARNVG